MTTSGPLGQLNVVLDDFGRLPTAAVSVSSYVPNAVAATIANGASVSAAIDTNGYLVSEIFVPNAGWSGADMTFDKSIDGQTWAALYDKTGTEYKLTIGALSAGRFIKIPSADLDGARYLRLRSGTLASPQNCSGSGCAIQVILRKLQ